MESKGNKLLSPGNPVVLEWDNNEGLILKKLYLDEKFLFKINQEVQIIRVKLSAFPYAQITRNKKPDDVQGFYIYTRFHWSIRRGLKRRRV